MGTITTGSTTVPTTTTVHGCKLFNRFVNVFVVYIVSVYRTVISRFRIETFRLAVFIVIATGSQSCRFILYRQGGTVRVPGVDGGMVGGVGLFGGDPCALLLASQGLIYHCYPSIATADAHR